jgi:hypothetical protein
MTPSHGILVVSAFKFSTPDLPAEAGVVVDEPDADAALRCPHRSRDASRASADDEDIEARLRIPIHPSSRPCLIDTGSGSFDNVAFH